MSQPNSLRNLYDIFDRSLSTGVPSQKAALVLMPAMNCEVKAKNIILLYKILDSSLEESKRIKKKPNLTRYISELESLHNDFVLNNPWTVPWNNFIPIVKGVMTTLDALANYYHDENATPFLDRDFLDGLIEELGLLNNLVFEADISSDLRKTLLRSLDDILTAIKAYQIDGNRGVGYAVDSAFSELNVIQTRLGEADKKSYAYRRSAAFFAAVFVFVKPSLFDIIGVIPDVPSFWMPKIAEFQKSYEKLTICAEKSPYIGDCFNEAVQNIINPQKELPAASNNKKLLTAAKE
jgi:hypothetical protein